MEKRPYAWQKECLQAWKDAGYHGVIHVITGAGKTFFAMLAIDALTAQYGNPLKVKVIVPTSALASQWQKSLISHGFTAEDTAIRSGTQHGNPQARFVIYIVNSARYSVSRQILSDMKEGRHVLLIADECHRYTGKENRKIYDFMKDPAFIPEQYSSLGLSATPQNPLFESVTVPALGRIIYTYDYRNGLQDETISPFTIFETAVPLNEDEQTAYDDLTNRLIMAFNRLKKRYPRLYEMKDSSEFFVEVIHLANREEPHGPAYAFLLLCYRRRKLISEAAYRIPCALQIVKQLPASERIIFFSEKISQAEALYRQLCEQFPNKAVLYHSEMNEAARRRSLNLFRVHEARMLVCCKALDEGLDVPDASTAIILSVSSTERQRIQRLGRVLRRSRKDKTASLYYLYVNGTSERDDFLHVEEPMWETVQLEYLPAEHDFSNIWYMETAAAVEKQYFRKGITTKERIAVMNAIQSGIIRDDWLQSEDYLSEKADEADSPALKNYYICMRWMAHSRTEKPEITSTDEASSDITDVPLRIYEYLTLSIPENT